MNTAPPRDAIYARQSVDKADSISIESQIEFCRYETRGAPCEVFADKGYSGKNTDRPEFQRMLQQIRRGRIRRVICYKLDRCSRSILDFTALMDEFQTYGVEFVSCTEKFDTSTPMGRAMLNICIVFAQLERETIQQRVADAYRSRSQKGFYMGGKAPFGFQQEPCTIEGTHTSRLRTVEAEAQILRFLYEEYAHPSVSLGDLVTLLREKGITNPRRADGQWVRSHIGRMLANPVYAKADMELYRYFKEKAVSICNGPETFTGTNGCYLFSGKDGLRSLVIAPHEGLVSSQLWLKCRKKYRNHQKKQSDHPHPDNWLTGRLICAQCGHTLAFSRKYSKNGTLYSYIVCPHSHGAGRICSGLKGWKEETAIQILSALIVTHLKSHYPVLSTPYSPGNSALDISIAQIQCEIEKAAAKAMETSGALLSHMNTHIHQLEQKKTELILQRKQQQLQQPTISPDYDRQWDLLSSREKTSILDVLIHKIMLSEGNITVIWKQKSSASCTFR